MPFIHSQANPGPRWTTLLLLPAPIGLEISGPDLLPSRPCPKPGRQTVSCVKVACDLGFPCKLGGQQDRSHCVCLTVMLHPPSRGIRDHCRLGQILAHSSRLLGVGCATTGSAWPCTMDKCAFAVTSGIYKPQCLMGTPQGTQPWSPSTTLPPSHTQAASISLTVPFWILSFVNLREGACVLEFQKTRESALSFHLYVELKLSSPRTKCLSPLSHLPIHELTS